MKYKRVHQIFIYLVDARTAPEFEEKNRLFAKQRTQHKVARSAPLLDLHETFLTLSMGSKCLSLYI